MVVGLLLLNSLLARPSLVAIFVLVALLQAVAAFHTPAMEALTQRLVDPAEYAAAGALGGFRGSAGAIAGPLLGGVLIASVGLTGAYLFDIAAMLFAFPVALFPALSLQWGDARMTGILFSRWPSAA